MASDARLSVMNNMNYGIDDGNGNQIFGAGSGLEGDRKHCRKVAQRMANERGKALTLYAIVYSEEMGTRYEEEFAPARPVVEATIGTPSTVLAECVVGWDYDVTVTIGEFVLAGAATLVPNADGDDPLPVSFGGDFSAWLSSEIADVIRHRDDRAAIAGEIEAACRAAGTAEA